MKQKVRTIQAVVFVHETEDNKKIEDSIKKFLPDATIEKEKLVGHYDTTIEKISLKVEGKELDEKLRELLSKIGAFEKGDIFSEIMKGMERNKIYLRLDKQELVKGLFKLDGDKQVKIVITFNSEKDARDYFANQIGQISPL
ncbi:MAG: RNA-binding domain-containing protein [Nitrososphaeria archaeon]